MKQIMRFTIAVFTFLCWSFAGLGQEIKGSVTDSAGIALPYATVNLKSKVSGAIVVYTTTDTRGTYTLRLPADALRTGLLLEVGCMGYKTQSKEITDAGNKIDFSLPLANVELPSVTVRSNRPVLRNGGDTTSYKVSEFTIPQDRVIGDIIKRLPGITVAADGTISYNNKPISGIYIGGDNLLDDKYSIAANTIPNGVVDKVQVIDNHQPIKVLQNKVNSNEVAINLTLTDKSKLHLLGQEMVGAGLPGNYYADLNAMLFNDGYKAINYLKANNTGDDLQRDLVQHNSAANQQRIGYDPPVAMLSLGSVNNPALSRSRYLFNHSGIFNINNLVNLTSGTQLRVNAYYLRDRQVQDYSQRTSIYLPGDTVLYTETQHNQFNPSLLHGQFTLNINKENYYVNDVVLMDDNHSEDHSALNTNGSVVNQRLSEHTFNFSNEFNLIRSLRSKNIIEGYSYFSHQTRPETRTIGNDYNDSLFNHGVPYQQLIQNANVPTWFTNNYFSFKIPGSFMTRSFKTGFSVQSQILRSDLNALQINNTLKPGSDSAFNNLNWVRKKMYAETAFDIPGTKLKANLTLPLTLQWLDYRDRGFGLDKDLTRLYFNPQLNIKYQTAIEQFVTLQYNYRSGFGDIEDIYQGGILKDYRSLYANNAELTVSSRQRAAVGYNYRKSPALFFISVLTSYDHTGANNIISSIITRDLQQRIALPYPNSTDAWSISGSISKYSFAWHTTFNGSAQWQGSRSEQMQNSILLPFKMKVKTFSLGAETKLNTWWNFSYHITSTLSSNASSLSTNQINQLLQQVAIYYKPTTNLQFKLTGDQYFTKRQGSSDLNYFFADASVKYRLQKWHCDLQFDVTNFVNIKTYNAFYQSANTFTYSSYTLPGRIVTVKLLFNL